MESKKSRYLFLICAVIFILTCSTVYHSHNNYKKELLFKAENNLIKSSQNYSVFILNVINPITTLIENTGTLLNFTDLNEINKFKSIFNKKMVCLSSDNKVGFAFTTYPTHHHSNIPMADCRLLANT